jgi:hypothetical protein
MRRHDSRDIVTDESMFAVRAALGGRLSVEWEGWPGAIRRKLLATMRITH